jgi:hypothetical protein
VKDGALYSGKAAISKGLKRHPVVNKSPDQAKLAAAISSPNSGPSIYSSTNSSHPNPRIQHTPTMRSTIIRLSISSVGTILFGLGIDHRSGLESREHGRRDPSR